MRKRHNSKGQATRERILTAALALFAEQGYPQTTMREIAARADCSLGLAYRYFKSKDTMVLALYDQMVAEFAEEAARLPAGTVAERWGLAVRRDIARLEVNRLAFMGLTSAGVTPGSVTQLLGREAMPIRERMLAIFRDIVGGSRDAPRPEIAAAFATLFYALYMVLGLFWLQDTSPGQSVTHRLIDFGEETLGRLRLVLRTRWALDALVRLADLLAPTLQGSRQAAP